MGHGRKESDRKYSKLTEKNQSSEEKTSKNNFTTETTSKSIPIDGNQEMKSGEEVTNALNPASFHKASELVQNKRSLNSIRKTYLNNMRRLSSTISVILSIFLFLELSGISIPKFYTSTLANVKQNVSVIDKPIDHEVVDAINGINSSIEEHSNDIAQNSNPEVALVTEDINDWTQVGSVEIPPPDDPNEGFLTEITSSLNNDTIDVPSDTQPNESNSTSPNISVEVENSSNENYKVSHTNERRENGFTVGMKGFLQNLNKLKIAIKNSPLKFFSLKKKRQNKNQRKSILFDKNNLTKPLTVLAKSLASNAIEKLNQRRRKRFDGSFQQQNISKSLIWINKTATNDEYMKIMKIKYLLQNNIDIFQSDWIRKSHLIQQNTSDNEIEEDIDTRIGEIDILRFLRAHKGNVDIAWKSIQSHDQWRVSNYGVESKAFNLSLFDHSPMRQEMFWLGMSLDNCPTIVIRTQIHDGIYYNDDPRIYARYMAHLVAYLMPFSPSS